MNPVDLALVLLLAGCALRGFWRGFFREGFGLLALIAAVGAALSFTAVASRLVQQFVVLPNPLPAALAFVGVFVVTYSVISAVGVVVDRLTGASLRRVVSQPAGALLGATKGVVIAAFVLLFIHLLPLAPTLGGYIKASAMARPLMAAASNVLRLHTPGTAQPGTPRA